METLLAILLASSPVAPSYAPGVLVVSQLSASSAANPRLVAQFATDEEAAPDDGDDADGTEESPLESITGGTTTPPTTPVVETVETDAAAFGDDAMSTGEAEIFGGEGDSFGAEDEGFFVEPEVPAEERVTPRDLGLTVGLGARYYIEKGSHRAAEYEHVEGWPFLDADFFMYGGGDSRVRFEGSLRNLHDFSADATYGFGEVFQLRIIAQGLHHAPDDPELVDLGSSSRYQAANVNLLDHPSIDVTKGRVKAFVKWPGYPAHLYLDGWLLYRYSQVHQDFLGGSGFYDQVVLTRRATFGESLFYDGAAILNAHLGPVEVEVEHRESGYNRLSDPTTYPYAGSLPAGGGQYVRHLLADMRGRMDEFRIHTDQGGRVNLAGAINRAEEKNLDNDLAAVRLGAQASITVTASPRLLLNARFFGRRLDWRVPEEYTFDNLTTGEVFTAEPKSPVEHMRLLSEAGLRYRPFKGSSVDLGFRRVDLRRPNGDEWMLPTHSVTNRVHGRLGLGASRTLDLKLGYQHEWVDAPSYNIDSRSWGRAELTANWRPTFYLSVTGRYQYAMGQRDALVYEIQDRVARSGIRKMGSHNAHGSIRVATADGIAVLAMYAYHQLQTDQDLIYDTWPTETLYVQDPLAVYREDVHQIIGDISWAPLDWMTVGARAHTSSSHGRLMPGEELALDPVSIGDFSSDRVNELRADAYMRFLLPAGFQFSVLAGWREVSFGDNPLNPQESGVIKSLAFSLAWGF